MRKIIQLKLSRENDLSQLTVHIQHRMEAGIESQHDSTQNRGADFVQSLVVQINGKAVVEAQLGASVADNPRFVFAFSRIQAGDKLVVLCTDNKGAEMSSDVLVVN